MSPCAGTYEKSVGAREDKQNMRKDLEERLVNHYPTWFNMNGDSRTTRMCGGFRHDNGWFSILWRLCQDLEPLVARFEKESGAHFSVLQVKEKFGVIRFYISAGMEEIYNRIAVAELESTQICELCGRPATRKRLQQFARTLCQEHAGWDEAPA